MMRTVVLAFGFDSLTCDGDWMWFLLSRNDASNEVPVDRRLYLPLRDSIGECLSDHGFIVDECGEGDVGLWQTASISG